MAIAHVNRVQGGNSVAATTIPSSVGGTSHTAGNLLVATFTWQTSNYSSIADTAGNTWTPAGSELVAGGSKYRIYYAYNCLGHANNIVTVTLASGGGYRSIVVHQFSGVQLTDPLLDSQTGSGSGTAIASASLSIGAASEAVIVAHMIGVANSIVTANGFTLQRFAITGDANQYFADEYKIVTAGAAATATQTSGAWAIKAASFAGAGGGSGGGGVVRHMLAHEHLSPVRMFKREQDRKRRDFVAMVDRQMRKAA